MALLPNTNLTSLLIPLKDVRDATNNFHEDNIISSGGSFGPAYKGLLLQSGKQIKIVARRLDRSYGLWELEFWNEVTVLSDLNHPNLVSMIGYCDEEDEKIIITTYEAKGSLACKLKNPNLTWILRLKICLGVARAVSYLHSDEGRDYGVIHCNIDINTILLDENWEPKLSGFEIAKKQLLNRMDQAIPCEPADLGMEEYIDPEIEKNRCVTYKSDIYSFGVVLYEILSGRLAFIKDDVNPFIVPLFRYHQNNRTVPDIIHPDLLSQLSMESIRTYLWIAEGCHKKLAYREDMYKIAGNLENQLKLEMQRENLVRPPLCCVLPFWLSSLLCLLLYTQAPSLNTQPLP